MPETPAAQEVQPVRRSWAGPLKKGFRRDLMIATMGFLFGSVLVGIDAIIPAHDDGKIVRGSTKSV